MRAKITITSVTEQSIEWPRYAWNGIPIERSQRQEAVVAWPDGITLGFHPIVWRVDVKSEPNRGQVCRDVPCIDINLYGHSIRLDLVDLVLQDVRLLP